MNKPYPAPGFLDRLEKICKDQGITLEELAEIAQIDDPELFKYYESCEIQIDEMTLRRIYDFDQSIDWMWLEHGYEPEDLDVIGDAEKLGVRYRC